MKMAGGGGHNRGSTFYSGINSSYKNKCTFSQVNEQALSCSEDTSSCHDPHGQGKATLIGV